MEDPVKSLTCGHVFESSAIKEWMKGQIRPCPMCRKPIAQESIVNAVSEVRPPIVRVCAPSADICFGMCASRSQVNMKRVLNEWRAVVEDDAARVEFQSKNVHHMETRAKKRKL